MKVKKGNKKFIALFIVALLLGFAAAFWFSYKPQEFIYTFF